MQYLISDHNVIHKLEINNSKITRKIPKYVESEQLTSK